MVAIPPAIPGPGPDGPGSDGGSGEGSHGPSGPGGDSAGASPPIPPATAGPTATPTISREVDPNQKLGPVGFGPFAFVSGESLLSYRIDFENDPSATAPAQQVDISDQLSESLDWGTFEFVEIGFGDNLIAIPPHNQYFQTTVSMPYNGQTFDVQIQVGLHTDTGEVFARFLSVDPATELPPDVLTGFLPPEDGTGRGQGHFSYTIKPKTGLPTGTAIRNIALITFGLGETIATNQIDPHDPSQGTDPAKEALNTIDAGRPISSVNSLPASSQASINVSWSGMDDAGGSGIASYDIFVSIDGAAFSFWLDDTQDLSAQYNGQVGHTYAFYSVATDNVGRVEEAPLVPDTITLVVPPPDTTPPKVIVTAVQGGLTQRSFVDTLQFDFTEQVNAAALINNGMITTAVTLTNLGINATVDPDQTMSVVPDQFRYEYDEMAGLSRLTWSLDAFAGTKNSLADGFYRLVLNSSLFTDMAGNPLDGDNDGAAGDSFVLDFHRLQGDANGDAGVDDADMSLVNAALGATPVSITWNANADLDRDLRITVRDRLIVARANGAIIVPPIAEAVRISVPGDFNGDGTVGAADYTVWRKNLGMTTGAFWSTGDADGDGAVDESDYQLWRQNFGTTLAKQQPSTGKLTARVSLATAASSESSLKLTLKTVDISADNQFKDIHIGSVASSVKSLKPSHVNEIAARDRVFGILADDRRIGRERLDNGAPPRRLFSSRRTPSIELVVPTPRSGATCVLDRPFDNRPEWFLSRKTRVRDRRFFELTIDKALSESTDDDSNRWQVGTDLVSSNSSKAYHGDP